MLRLILLVLAAVHVAMCQAASMLKGGDAQNEASAGAMWAKSLEVRVCLLQHPDCAPGGRDIAGMCA